MTREQKRELYPGLLYNVYQDIRAWPKFYEHLTNPGQCLYILLDEMVLTNRGECHILLDEMVPYRTQNSYLASKGS